MSTLGDYFPSGMKLEKLLVPGGAFRCYFGDREVKYRYLFIGNKKPKSGLELMVFTTTTKIAEHR